MQAKAQTDAKTDSPELAQVNFGPKYEQHVAELQARINELTALCAPLLTCAAGHRSTRHRGAPTQGCVFLGALRPQSGQLGASQAQGHGGGVEQDTPDLEVQPRLASQRGHARRIEGMRTEATDSAAERARLTEDLAEARERVRAEEDAQRSAAERQEASSRELEIMRVELTASRQNVEKAEFDKAKARVWRPWTAVRAPLPVWARWSGSGAIPAADMVLESYGLPSAGMQPAAGGANMRLAAGCAGGRVCRSHGGSGYGGAV